MEKNAATQVNNLVDWYLWGQKPFQKGGMSIKKVRFFFAIVREKGIKSC